MSLNIGVLAGILELDAKPFSKGLDAAEAEARRAVGGIPDAELRADVAGFVGDVDAAVGKADGALSGIPAAHLEVDGDGFVSDVDQAVDKAKGSFSKLKLAAAAAFASAGAVVAKAFGDAMDIGAGRDKLAAQLGLTEQESEKAGGIAGSLYANAYGESMDEVSAALGAVGSSLGSISKTSEADLERWATKALNVAAAFEVDVQRAVSTTGVVLKSGLARDADHAFDLIVTSMQKVPAHLREDLLDAADEYSQFFADLGFSGEEAFGALTAAAEDGMYGIDKMGDAIKEFTIRATDGSDLTGRAFWNIGKHSEDMAVRIVAGGQSARKAFDETIAGLLAIEDPSKRANMALALFGTPLEDLSVADIPKFLESLQSMNNSFDSVEGAATKMGDTLNDNAAVKIETFKRTAMMGLTNFIGNNVIPMIEKLADDGGWALEAFGVVMGAVAVAAMVHAGTMAVAWAIALGPIPWVIAAVAGLVFLIVKHWDTIKSATIAPRAADVDFIIGAGKMLVGGAKDAVMRLIELYTLPQRKAAEVFANVGKWLYNAGKDLIGGFIRGITDKIGDVKDTLGGLTKHLPSWKGPAETDARILRPAGRSVISGFIRGLDDEVGNLRAYLAGVTAMVETGVQPSLGGGMSSAAAMAAAGAGGGYRTANVRVDIDGRTLVRVLGQELVDEVRLRTGAAA